MTTQDSAAPVAIIGWGTAGVNALIGLRTAGYAGRVLVFSATDTAPYSPILTSYYAGGAKTYEQCFPWTAEELADLQAEVHASEPVVAMDLQAHAITTAKDSYIYSKCIIATGATPLTRGFPQVEDYEPLVLRTMDDAQRLKEAISPAGDAAGAGAGDAAGAGSGNAPAATANPRRILISGASMVALKTLEACLAQGADVTLVGIAPQVLDRNALPQVAARFEADLRAKGAKLRLGQCIKAVSLEPLPDGGRQLRVTFSTGDVDCFDDISVSHGMGCNLDFVPAELISPQRALLVDEFMRTANPDVYAAGDVAQGLDLSCGEKRVVGIWKNAAVQGNIAGRAIAAELDGRAPSAADAFKGAIPMNTIAVDGTLFLSGGLLPPKEGYEVEYSEPDGMLLALIYEQGGASGKAAANDATAADVAPAAPRRLVGFNLSCSQDIPGSRAYDLGAMLMLQLEKSLRAE